MSTVAPQNFSSKYSWMMYILFSTGIYYIDWEDHEIGLNPELFFAHFTGNTPGLVTSVWNGATYQYEARITVDGVTFTTLLTEEDRQKYLVSKGGVFDAGQKLH
jgi:hypothetical protein